eukprot:gene11239-12419_t
MAAVENMVKIVDNLSNNEHKKGDNCLEIALRDNEAFNCKNITKLSHKLWRRLWKKEKRRKIRQQMAKEFELLEKEEQIKLGLTTSEAIEANRKQEEWRSFLEEKKRQKLHEEWLEREKVAQDEFKRQRTEEERRRQERLDQEKRIKDEWEKQERVEKDRKEHKEKKAKERENNLTKELEKSGIIKSTTDEENWHNPIAEVIPEKSKLYGTEQDPNNCAFYLKTGACRFGERCSRQHPRPENSKTLLIPNMFQDVRLTETMLDEKNQDAGLEFDEDELYQNFREFYKDVVSEFKSCGDLYQFKVCSNFEQHLRGNVYVQYFSEDDALKAFSKFNGRWYAGKQLSVQFSPVTKWKSAICGTQNPSSPRLIVMHHRQEIANGTCVTMRENGEAVQENWNGGGRELIANTQSEAVKGGKGDQNVLRHQGGGGQDRDRVIEVEDRGRNTTDRGRDPGIELSRDPGIELRREEVQGGKSIVQNRVTENRSL